MPVLIVPPKKTVNLMMQTDPLIYEPELVHEPNELMLPYDHRISPDVLEPYKVEPRPEIELPLPEMGKDWSETSIYKHIYSVIQCELYAKNLIICQVKPHQLSELESLK